MLGVLEFVVLDVIGGLEVVLDLGGAVQDVFESVGHQELEVRGCGLVADEQPVLDLYREELLVHRLFDIIIVFESQGDYITHSYIHILSRDQPNTILIISMLYQFPSS